MREVMYTFVRPTNIKVYYQHFSWGIWFLYTLYYIIYTVLGPLSWIIFFLVRKLSTKKFARRLRFQLYNLRFFNCGFR